MREQFERDGFVVLRDFFSQRVMDHVRADAEAITVRLISKLHASGQIDHAHEELPFEKRLIPVYKQAGKAAPGLFNQELHCPGFFEFFFNQRLLDLVESFLGKEVRLYPNYYLRPKMPGDEAFRVLWHQDAAYTDAFKGGGSVEILRTVNCWAALVPATVENGCMQFIPGSHKLGLVPYTQQTHYLEIAPEHLQPQLSKVIDVTMNPGDVVLFHNLLFHQGLPNNSNTIRWSIDWRYQDATQPTLRPSNGHLARSKQMPAKTVASAQDWVSRASA